MKTLVIVPAYNEQDNIIPLIRDIRRYRYDYLVINDCSNDDTAAILDKSRIEHLDLPVNLGIAGVTQVGFKYACDHGYDCAVCIDGDGQHLPSYISALVEQIEEGSDYVVGSRFLEEDKPLTMRMIGSRILCMLIRMKTGKKVTDPTSGMRALDRKVMEDFAESMNFCAEPDALCHLLRKGFKVKEVQVKMKERESGKSYFANPFKSVYFMLSVALSIIFIQ